MGKLDRGRVLKKIREGKKDKKERKRMRKKLIKKEKRKKEMTRGCKMQKSRA